MGLGLKQGTKRGWYETFARAFRDEQGGSVTVVSYIYHGKWYPDKLQRLLLYICMCRWHVTLSLRLVTHVRLV